MPEDSVADPERIDAVADAGDLDFDFDTDIDLTLDLDELFESVSEDEKVPVSELVEAISETKLGPDDIDLDEKYGPEELNL